MRRRSSSLVAVLVLPLLFLPPSGAALAQATPGRPMAAMAAAPGRPAPPADRDLMAGMGGMEHDMAAAPMTGNADRDFAAMMIPHHRGAVAMAQAELRDGHDPRMRELATRIVADQDREIALMQHWLETHPGSTAGSTAGTR